MPKHIVQEIIENAGYEARSYSGRGMYGEKCLATDPGPSIGSFIADLIQNIREESHAAAQDSEEFDQMTEKYSELENALRNMATDSMGRGTVMYFKDVPYTNENQDS